MNYILGLDVSTSKLGLSILDTDKNLVESQTIKIDNKTSRADRSLVVEHVVFSLYSENFINKKNKYKSTKVYIESPFMMFSGGNTTAMTISKLQRFNGMV